MEILFFMDQEIIKLEPKLVWKNFNAINAIPRPSKKEEAITAFVKDFGISLNLKTIQDSVGNVIIKKPASFRMNDHKTVVLQSHLDMVHQKNSNTKFDFLTQGINMYVDGDWVKAKGTTLGADNGLGVAAILAILESNDIPHPPIEALFTIDEETGMTGAIGLDDKILDGDILLNLDTEEDNEIGVGCAGGIDITATLKYNHESCPVSSLGYELSVTGLKGGHSGMDIHKGFGNANKFMSRLLYDGFDKFGLRVSKIDGGSLRNAIPRESKAIITIDKKKQSYFEDKLKKLITCINNEYATLEPDLLITLKPCDLPKSVMELTKQENVIKALKSLFNGVFRMSPDINNLVETSNNLARVSIENGNILIGCLTRSSVDSSKFDLANCIKATFELAGFNVKFSGDYPGWTPNMDSAILKILEKLYIKLNNSNPIVAACHAGLECGILGKHYPEMEMISFGPNIKGAHSPDERLQISSVQKFWIFLKSILAEIPKKE